MEPVQIYGLAAGGIFVLAFLYRASSFISRWIQNRTLFYIFKYLLYPMLIRRSRFFSPLSRWHAILLSMYWLGTAACNIVGVSTITQAGNRAGALATLHLIPLLFTNRVSFAADLLGISLQTYMRLHTSVGLMALLQSLIHISIFLSHHAINLKEDLHFYGFLAAVALASLLPLSFMRWSFFEFFQKTHLALAILIAYSIWRHLSLNSAFARLYVVIAGCIFGVTTIMRYSRLILRNFIWKQPYGITQVIQVGDSIRVRVAVPRPWRVRAGQYVYIWMPGASFWSPFQSHPFMISWWDNDTDGRSSNIYLLVKPANGFTQRLMQHTGNYTLKSWIDGPYGKVRDIGNYGSIVMFASGIGIATQVPYLKELIRGYKEYRVRTKSILLVWQLNKESDQDWVQDWMTELLSEDQGAYILRIGLYVLRNFDDQNTKYGEEADYGRHHHIRKLYGKPDIDEIIRTEVVDKRGRLLVTTSAQYDMQNQVQKSVHRYLDKDIKLLHLAFQPREARSFWSPRPPEVEHQGVV